MFKNEKDYMTYLYTEGLEDGPHCISFLANPTLISSFVSTLRKMSTQEEKAINALSIMPLNVSVTMVTYKVDSLISFLIGDDDDEISC